MIEYNDENAPHPGFNDGKSTKTRAISLGHDMKENVFRKHKRSSENIKNETDCKETHSDKQRRALQVCGNQTGSYPFVSQRKSNIQLEKPGVSKTQIHKSSNHDTTQLISVVVGHNKAARTKRKGREREAEKISDVPDIPLPHKVVPNDEPMDVDNPTLVLRNNLKSPPPGVADIDHRNCPLLCSQFAQDIMDYLQARDTTLPRSAEYVHRGEITPKMRGILVDWLGQVQTFEGLTSESLHMCVYMVDRYLTQKLIPLARLQLLGISSILIAAKVVERFPPEIPALCHLTADAYRPGEVLVMEREVLNRLRFDLNVPGPIVFLDRYLQVDKHEDEVENLCLYLLDLSLTNTRFVPYSASKMAASTLYLARFLFHSGPTWTMALVYYTKFTVENIMACVRLFALAVCKADNSSFQNARNKFNTKNFGFISMNRMLEKSRVLVIENLED